MNDRFIIYAAVESAKEELEPISFIVDGITKTEFKNSK